MLDTLTERENGMDDQWMRCYLDEQEVVPSETAQLRIEIRNHSHELRTAIAQPILPES